MINIFANSPYLWVSILVIPWMVAVVCAGILMAVRHIRFSRNENLSLAGVLALVGMGVLVSDLLYYWSALFLAPMLVAVLAYRNKKKPNTLLSQTAASILVLYVVAAGFVMSYTTYLVVAE